MKKYLKIAIVCLALVIPNLKAHAQWTVIDPSNLVQNIQQVVQSSTTASHMIKSLQESIRIYEQGKAYYDALKSVHSLIKDAKKVQRTVEMVGEITSIYVNGFSRMVADPNFTSGELAAISDGYAILLSESAAVLSDLRPIVTAGNGLSMSDKERMDEVNRMHDRMLEYRNLTQYFTNKNISVSFIRARAKNETARVLSLYGKPNERYW